MAKIVFISDIHMSVDTPALNSMFKRLLAALRERGDVAALVMVGDIFDAWMGDDNDDPEVEGLIPAIRDFAQGIPVGLMRGNRDFLLGKKFQKKVGFPLIDDPCRLEAFGAPITLSHGDSMCTLDEGYIKFRSVVDKRWVRFLFFLLPLFARKRVAAKIRMESRKIKEMTLQSTGKTPAKYDVTIEGCGMAIAKADEGVSLEESGKLMRVGPDVAGGARAADSGSPMELLVEDARDGGKVQVADNLGDVSKGDLSPLIKDEARLALPIGKLLDGSIKLLVHGHTHKPAIHLERLADGVPLARVVLPDWYSNLGGMLVMDEGMSMRLVDFDEGNIEKKVREM